MKKRTKYAPPADATPGFAIKLTGDTQLGLAMLVVEDEDGKYEPVGVASTINEAHEMAECHFRHRCNDMDGLCPHAYKVWAQGIDGDYRLAATIDPLEKF